MISFRGPDRYAKIRQVKKLRSSSRSCSFQDGRSCPGQLPAMIKDVIQTNIYEKNLRRLGLILIAVSILDLILELTFYRVLLTTASMLGEQVQTPLGICLKDGLGLITGLLAYALYSRRKHSRLIVRFQLLLLCAAVPIIISSTRGSAAKRVDGLINVTLLLMAMVVYTALELERSERIWRRVRDTKPAVLDLKLNDSRQWFNPIEIGPKLELSQDISSVVDRFLETSRWPRPLEITIHCPHRISEPMQATMQEVFEMYYEDEERHVNRYLEGRYNRVMALVIISIAAVTLWIRFSPSSGDGIAWTIISNFAGFSLWQIGSTYFERSEGYEDLLRALIAKQAKLHFEHNRS